MYKAYDFIFAGVSASMYGMYVADIGNKKHGDVPFGNQANIVERRIANRVKPIHYGVRYNDTPLSFTLIFGADRVLDRFEMQEIVHWLTGYQDYQWLSIDQPDLAHVQFRCIVQSLTPVSIRWLPVAFEAKIVCDCPYGYSFPFSKTIKFEDGTSVLFRNDSTCREGLYPNMYVTLADGCTEFSILNSNTGEAIQFSGLPRGGLSFSVDNENGVIAEATYGIDLYDYFNFSFLSLEPGDNTLVFTGNGTVTLSGRYLYNVGA